MNKGKMILSLIIIAVVILMGLGTYAFFTADIVGNIENNNIVQKTGTLSIEYIEGQNINAEGIIPGWSGVKTFKIKNTGTHSVSYDIVFDDAINKFINDEIIFSGTCISNQTTCENIEQGIVADESFFIKQDISIEPNEEHSYEIEISFIETGANQDYNNQATLTGKISVYEAGAYKIPLDITIDIIDNMIPVSWSGSTLIKADKTNKSNNWYDYDNQKWANAVLVTNESRENYKTTNQGTQVIEEDILAYYTYIPRYRYLLWNANNNENCLNDNCNEQEIIVKFESKTRPKSLASENGQWLTHPSFTLGDKELNGIWVGKFTTSVDPNSACYTDIGNNHDTNINLCNNKSLTPRVKPNIDMWKHIDTSTMFSVTKQIETNSMYGLNSYDNADSHMMKNMEWGAVAYLSHSKYGKYGNDKYSGQNKQVYINNYRAIELTGHKTETGCSGGGPDIPQNHSNCAHPYPLLTLEATGASTTGNIYGVYDMSGGVREYVMGQLVQEGTELGKFYENSQSGSWDTIPGLKYYDSYKYDTSELSHGNGHLGDATRETLKTFGTSKNDGWHGDYSSFPNNNNNWFLRGGDSYNQSDAGLFAFINDVGDPFYYRGFRMTLAFE